MTKEQIKQLAEEAGLPDGWYKGPWFDDRGRIRTGVSDHLHRFVNLVEAAARSSIQGVHE